MHLGGHNLPNWRLCVRIHWTSFILKHDPIYYTFYWFLCESLTVSIYKPIQLCSVKNSGLRDNSVSNSRKSEHAGTLTKGIKWWQRSNLYAPLSALFAKPQIHEYNRLPTISFLIKADIFLYETVPDFHPLSESLSLHLDFPSWNSLPMCHQILLIPHLQSLPVLPSHWNAYLHCFS